MHCTSMRQILLKLALGVAIFAPATFAAAVPLCSELAPGLSGSAGVKSVNSLIIPASGPNVAYCQVNILFGENGKPEHQHSRRLAAQLARWRHRRRGGRLERQNARSWRRRLFRNPRGHCSCQCTLCRIRHRWRPRRRQLRAWCKFGWHVQRAVHPGLEPQRPQGAILFSKALATVYYAAEPQYNYWNGCSTGGRQGYLLAQELGSELDGILANAPAIYWTRFQTAQMWGQIVMKDLTGGVIPTAKQNFATSKATAACDALDGVTDGIIDDPRACTYSAANDPSAICAANGGTSADVSCLTPAQAQAMDKIWDGPRNASGVKVWFHSEPGSGTTVWNGPAPFALAVTQFHWDEHDRNFDWRNVTMFGAGGTDSYADIAYDGSNNALDPAVNPDYSLADATDTFGNLDTFKKHGGKLLTMVGGYDNFIMPRGVIKYYREMASRYGKNPNNPDFASLQSFYRLFRAPGVGHCGGGVGPQPQNLFGALVNWVETGVAPDSILASGGSLAPPTGRTRPLCPYRQRPSTTERAAPTTRRISTAGEISRRRRRSARTCWPSTSMRTS
jgi:hypothetical protein